MLQAAPADTGSVIGPLVAEEITTGGGAGATVAGGDDMSVLDYNLSRSQWEQLIDEWVIGLNAERNRAILKRRLLDGVLMEPLAEEFNLSVRHTRNIVRKGLEILTKHI